MKKKLFLSLFLLLLAAVGARAEIVGDTPDGSYIHRLTAPDGSEVFVVSIEQEPDVYEEDVNFDGVSDLVVVTAMGASNAVCSFFVKTEDGYVRAQPYSGGELYNHRLMPEQGLVVSDASNGMAGLLREVYVYRWEGTDLIPVRSAVIENVETTDFEDDFAALVTRVDMQTLVLRVTEYAYGEDGVLEPDVLIEETFLDPSVAAERGEPSEEERIFDELDEALFGDLT